MNKIFDGNSIQQEIIKKLPTKGRVGFAVISISSNKISQKYLALKERLAKGLNITFIKIFFNENVTQHEIIQKINKLNSDKTVDAIMIQMPIPKRFNRDLIISKIDKIKDVDGLRYCSGLKSNYLPPVVLSILGAIERSEINLADSTVCQIGKGFLVGTPLLRYFKDSKKNIRELLVADKCSPDISALTKSADIIISAAGHPSIIKKEMISKGCVLIDAGTTELNGSLVGDIDKNCYGLARYYTPVPRGIGPVTIAMLMKNILAEDGGCIQGKRS